MKTQLYLIAFALLASPTAFAQAWSPTGAAPAINAQYLTAATHIGNTIFVVGNNQSFGLSTDKGSTWSKPTITPPPGTFAALSGVAGRLYASMKINTYDYELHYSTDNGNTWTIDTVGLPKNVVKTGKAAMNLVDMGNNYILAYNATTARYKKATAPSWTKTTIDNVIVSVTAMNGKWYAVGTGKILKSTDNGSTWNPISTSGLPANFQGNTLATNRQGRLFVSTPPADGGEDIYYSDDEGASWTVTNSAGHYTHSNPWVGAMYAVGDYVFAAISPKFGAFQDPPPFIMSSTSNPSFAVGDTTGLGSGLTTTALPFFFHIGEKLFTMMGDLYSSKPGFASNVSISENKAALAVFPNPVSNVVNISTSTPMDWQLFGPNGVIIEKGNTDIKNRIDFQNRMDGIYLLVLTNGTENKVMKLVKH